MSQQNVEVVRTGYGAFARRDGKALRTLIREHLDPEFTWTSIVTGSTYKGPAALLELIDDIEATVDYIHKSKRPRTSENMSSSPCRPPVAARRAVCR